jgi:uncharacterized protein YuzE
MKFKYYAETDSLYIDLSEKTSVDSNEVAPGVVLDFDADGNLVGIDIDHASKIVNLAQLEAQALPIQTLAVSRV